MKTASDASIANSEHLTQDSDLRMRRLQNQTYAHQAHWGGTGPEGATCRLCAHWDNQGEYYTGMLGSQKLKPAACLKYQRMVKAKTSKKIPHNALACRFFKAFTGPERTIKKSYSR